MGTFAYSDKVDVKFDDRTLAHLQVVIGAKLRRAESFYFTWPADPENNRRRSTIWLNSTHCLVFEYEADTMPAINRSWIEILNTSANSGSGLQLLEEPAPALNLVPNKSKATR
ncbi:DUF7882 family protein [Subtercola sp. YIM 133946]|uniref:DUF7882 family protein n=1 Tax=Subtercola sp. YIM 133946 TaxID=3118909 RepID=UPI002F92DCF2